MAESWTTLRELLLPTGEAGAQPGRGLESSLRTAIRAGRLRTGERLPSSRDLAAQIGVARGTVTAVYRQLVAEGYLEARHGSGTWIADVAPPPAAAAKPSAPAPERYRLGPGMPSLGAFPRSAWLSALRQGCAELTDVELGYPDPAGLLTTRTELAGYLGRVRGVVTDPAGVVITHGTFEALNLLCAVLRADGQTEVAVEDPGNQEQYELLAARGLRGCPVPVDDEGIRVDALARTDCRAVIVTSAHQYPLGVSMSPGRRRALLEWAGSTDGLVIEDDYDAEYRYDRAPVGALQAIYPDSVAYVGTLSKTMAPALRLGWLVPPARMLEEVVRQKRLHDRGGSALDQAALTMFLRNGGYDRHLRRTRLLYRERRDALLAALAEFLPDWRPIGIAGGLHLVVQLPSGLDDRAVVERLVAQHIHLSPLSRYANTIDLPPGLVIGYATLTPARLRSAAQLIAKSMADQSGLYAEVGAV
ncbi:PLP-dependent aminotransferase family protein [Kribbella catacumbae]|uniref:MocR-like pyridoxine biosynthesis transcription factor PdxR n=1 Tax=Kribbella catacumbae TaxID=460086 RepID=UPI000369DC16|nr:PLP-dependent aminotransferase family protein [Kribbella catacumbae]